MVGRKGQSAMEYLMTYGWAILVIIIVIAVLFYIGVLNPRNVTPQNCMFPPGLSCSSFKLYSANATLDLKLGQAKGHPIKILGIRCTQETGTPSSIDTVTNQTTIPIGEERWITGGDSANTMYCKNTAGTNLSSGTLGEFYKGKIWIQYNETDTGVNRTVVGDLATKYEQ